VSTPEAATAHQISVEEAALLVYAGRAKTGLASSQRIKAGVVDQPSC
jgi:hypothetical protein